MPGIKDVIIGLDTSSSPLVAVVERGGKKYASRRKGSSRSGCYSLY